MQPIKPVNVSASPQEHSLLLAIKTELDFGIAKLQQGDAETAVSVFKRALHMTPPHHFSAYGAVSHNLLIAYKQLIEKLLLADDITPVNPHLPEVFALELRGDMASDPEIRGRFADAFYDIGKLFYRARQYDAALAFVRRAIAIQPCPSYYVDLANALGMVKTRAQLEDYTRAYPPPQLGLHVFIACAPKSGSTFLKNVLVQLTQFKDLFSTYAALQNEHELDLPQLAKFGAVNTVTQQHCRASEANIHLMQAFNISPVILVRNIFDTVLSLLDFYDGGFTFSTFHGHEDYLRLSNEERIDLLIEYAVPWYFQFAASWQRAEKEGRLSLHWLSYEDMIADKPAALERVLGFYGMSAKKQDIERTIAAAEADHRNNRFNKGVAGRGQSGLSATQRKNIMRLARYFPSTDFGLLGL